MSKHLKQNLQSTVLSIDWHPGNALLAAGSADSTVRVYSAYIKGLEDRPQPGVWGDRLPFNALLAEEKSLGWVHGVAFAPSGDALGYASHDGSVHILYPTNPPTVRSVTTEFLPFTTLTFLGDNSLVAGGFSCTPVLFTGNQANGWVLSRNMDKTSKKEPVEQQESSAINMFRALDYKGRNDSSTALPTVHQNSITQIRQGPSPEFTTSGIDGRIVRWSSSASLAGAVHRMAV